MVPWFRGSVVPWFRGSVVPWFRGSVVPWFRGSVVPWFRGSVVPWSRGPVLPCSENGMALELDGTTAARGAAGERSDPAVHEPAERTRPPSNAGRRARHARGTQCACTVPEAHVMYLLVPQMGR
ncbi:hypothetical protein GCM10009869_36870 [Amnibacterium kyonggiense]